MAKMISYKSIFKSVIFIVNSKDKRKKELLNQNYKNDSGDIVLFPLQHKDYDRT